MPEIPEMEIYKDYLNNWVKNKRVVEVNIFRAKSVNMESADFRRMVIGKLISDVIRKGKYLIFHLDNGHFLLNHMMLDGRLYFLSPDYTESTQENGKSAIAQVSGLLQSNAEEIRQRIKALPGKPSIVFALSDGSVLLFCSLTLGYLHYLGEDQLGRKLRELGRDPLDPKFDAFSFSHLLEGKKGMIKPWLMNQRNIAGVGNAYSNEALFGSGILPTRLIHTITLNERVSLYHALVKIIQDSIRLGGDMEEPFATWDDFTGGYNPYFKVYDRVGKPCLVCHELIQKSEVGGRNAFFCSNCQH